MQTDPGVSLQADPPVSLETDPPVAGSILPLFELIIKGGKVAAKPINMDQIRSLLQQSDNNVSIRSMERNTGISRNTIRGYLRRIQEHG